MKKMQSLVLACVGLASVLSINTASAGNRPGALSVTVGGGYEWLAHKREMKNTGQGFLAVGWDFTREWGVNAYLNFFNTKFRSDQNDHRSISGNLFLFDGVYHIPVNEIVQPFVTFGVGLTGLNPNRTDANNEGNINAGVGVQFFIHPSIAFQFDARDLYTWVGGKNDVLVNAGITALIDFC